MQVGEWCELVFFVRNKQRTPLIYFIYLVIYLLFGLKPYELLGMLCVVRSRFGRMLLGKQPEWNFVVAVVVVVVVVVAAAADAAADIRGRKAEKN